MHAPIADRTRSQKDIIAARDARIEADRAAYVARLGRGDLRFDATPLAIVKLVDGQSLTDDEGRSYMRAQKKAFKGIVGLREFFRLASNAADRDRRAAA